MEEGRNRPTIGAVLIVKNEEAMLADCLESLKGLDAIYIADTGSTDRTVEIAKRYTDDVYTDFVWCDSFAKARNFILGKAKTDFCLSIDADETLESVKAVREAVALAGEHKAIDICIQSKTFGNFHYVPKLFKRDPSVFWKGDIHNHLSIRGVRIGTVKTIAGWSPAHLNDPDRALRILTKVVTENPNAVREKFYLGREHYEKGHYEDSIHWMTEYLKVGTWDAEKAEAYLTIARSYWNTQRGPLAREACLQAIRANPDFKEALNLMSEMHYSPHKEKWANLAKAAQNKDVLFTRAVVIKSGIDTGIEGWMTPAELEWLHETAKTHRTIVEIGSWKGRSTYALLTGNPNGTVTAIDTWKGSSDPKDKTHGRDTFKDFTKNVGHFKNLIVNRNRGVDAAKEYADKSLDMVFIDAGHTYEEVKEDIRAWLPKVRPGGILCGHDYHPQKWPGVVQAVDEMLNAPDGTAETIWFKNIT